MILVATWKGRVLSIQYNNISYLELTLNLSTSSMRAVLPSLTQDWKKLGATETPRASLVMPVDAWAALLAITRNVPKSKTNRCCVYLGSDANNLQEKRNAAKRKWVHWMRNEGKRKCQVRSPCKDRLIYAYLGGTGGSNCYSCFYYTVHWLIVWPGLSKKAIQVGAAGGRMRVAAGGRR